jgi:murein DD-endopeptidase MepM/ murein hydrolase activator NlpD
VKPLCPFPGSLYVTDRFGAPRAAGPHQGVDLRAPVGTPIVAPQDGVVWNVDDDPAGSGGKQVSLRMLDRRMSFSHMSSIVVKVGPVKRGQLLGYSGATGNVTGPHVHAEMRAVALDGTPAATRMDPMEWLVGAQTWEASALVDGYVGGADIAKVAALLREAAALLG